MCCEPVPAGLTGAAADTPRQTGRGGAPGQAATWVTSPEGGEGRGVHAKRPDQRDVEAVELLSVVIVCFGLASALRRCFRNATVAVGSLYPLSSEPTGLIFNHAR